ncbi:mercury methylation corrinoid protein HgcA [uncultured Methanomethylovorans sp.]|uniref:mercury methylation corrinoid protein HgcA n=1 Tax=uncultured Methanomethylovorans sp. TaxID=183759 RepID=UPI002AA8BEEC|nr:mercury methylation corrinoid protein HgcA [uncultured Methanomethylovorans sp.]
MASNKNTSSPCACEPRSDKSQFITLTNKIQASEILKTTSELTLKNRLDHVFARLGVNRMGHIIKPGLYKLGNPTPDSLVFVSANYTLSFDAVRSALSGIDCYILVLDTKGINVWCAAGKGTFGTEELIQRIMWSGLSNIVRQRTVILPQLGAPGISAHDVQRRSGFKIEFGPVRANDLPEYLKTHTATPEMRRVHFSFKDRLVLTPVEFRHALLPTIVATTILFFLAGPLVALAGITTVITGTIIFPALLPFIPTHDFSTKGLILGALANIPFAISVDLNPEISVVMKVLISVILFLMMPTVTAYLALNFTGCTTFTSRTGVKKEIYRYVPIMAMMAVFGLILSVILGVIKLMKVI